MEVPDSAPNTSNLCAAGVSPQSHEYATYHSNSTNNEEITPVMISIDVPSPNRDEPRFPKEKWKTFIAFIILSVSFFLSTLSLAITHDRVPDRSIGPLPDIVLDNVTAIDWMLGVSEILIMFVVNTCIIIVLFHKNRFIVARRIFLIMSVLYLMRSLTMFVTVLPVSSQTYFCSPKSNNTTFFQAIGRAFSLISGFGLSINGKQNYCGDFIYSGHTVMLVLGYLVISEYTPKKLFLLHWLAFVNAVVGVVMLLFAHGHYTIDVLIAYYVTTRLFWSYHTLANNHWLLKQNGYNYLGREFWFPVFKYFEANIRCPLANEFEVPWPRTNSHIKLPHRETYGKAFES